jgi:hypothetical protein
MTDTPNAGFRDATSLTNVVTWLLYATIVVSIVAVVSGMVEHQLLTDLKLGTFSSRPDADTAADASDTRQQIVGIVQFVLFLVSGVVILKWIHRANYNARQLGANGMEFTPGMSVGWYFIPFANLVKPYQAMKEIWKASANPADWTREVAPGLLGVWWLFWIASNLLGNATFRMSMRAETIDELIASNVVTQLSDFSEIPLCVVFLFIVRRIDGMQREHRMERLAPMTEPPAMASAS